MIAGILGTVRSTLADRQFRAGIDLVSSSALNAIAGLAFWFVAARSFDESVVGVNSAVIALMGLVENLSSLGMKNGLIRFLPGYGRDGLGLVGRTYALTGGVTLVLAPLFAVVVLVAGVDEFTLFDTAAGVAAFALACLVWIVFVLQDSVLISLGRTGLIPIANLVYAIAKLVLLGIIALAFADATWGIFIAWVLPVIVVVVWVNTVAVRSYRSPRRSGGAPQPRETGLLRFAAGEHASLIINTSLFGLLPIFVLAELGEEASAFYYLAWTIAYNLMLVNSQVSTALLAEASLDRDRLSTQTAKAIRQMAYIVVPAAVITIIAAPLGLRVFGESYSSEASTLLRLLALAAIANIIVSASIGVLRARREPARLFALYLVRTMGLGALCVGLAIGFGLEGIGWGWVIGEWTLALVLLATHLRPVVVTLLPSPVVAALSTVRARRRVRTAARRVVPAVHTIAPDATSHRVLSASADVTVVEIATPGAALVAKVPSSDVAVDQLAHEHAVLESLASLDAIGPEWRSLVPSARAERPSGALVQDRLDGRPIADDDDTGIVTDAAFAAITPLHRATGTVSEVGPELLDRIVDEPIRMVVRWRPELEQRLVVVAEQLRDRLPDPIVACRVHGDFAPGNVLWHDERRSLAGMVDWELSRPDLPPEIDTVHFVLALASERSPDEYGTLVTQVLRGRGPIDAVAAAAEAGANHLDVHTAATLAWLHHVAANLRKSIGSRRNDVWFDRNVERVVEAVHESTTHARHG